MTKNKTTANDKSPAQYIAAISPATKQADAQLLLELCERLTGEKAKMWGPSMLGSGSYHYKYESGREGDMPLAAFASRASTLVVYLSGEIQEQQQLLDKLGTYKMGKSCLHIKKLEQIDLAVLEELMNKSIEALKKKYPEQG